MSRTVGSIIAGRPATDAPGGRETSTNPADTRRPSPTSCSATPAPSSPPARRRARRSASGPPCPAPVRGRAIQQLGRLVEDNKEALSRLVTREIGKPYAESLGEVQEIVDTCNFFVGEGRRLYGQTVPSEMPDKQLFTFRDAGRRRRHHHRRQLPGGRAVLVPRPRAAVRQRRRSGSRPSTRRRWPRRWPSCSCTRGLPDGVLNLVLADGPQTFAGLEQALDRGLVDKVGFTGSSAVGARIGELCGRHLQSPCLELGGKNPLVVMADADLDLAVEGALFSGFGTAGQRCTSLGTVIVDERVHDEFFTRLKTAVEGAAIGDPIAGRAVRPDDPRALPGALRERVARADPRPPQRPRLDRARGASPPPTRARDSWAATRTRASSCTPRSWMACAPTTTWPTPRPSARWSASRPSATGRRPSRWPTATATA